jgi:L-alanine-DL-glutamate epimerase-like enolase superfamily enzyme
VRITGLELFAVPPRWLFLSHAGGLLEPRKIAAMAEASRCTTTSADLLDYVRDASVFAVRDGHMAVSDGPGLGVEIDEERVREAAGAAPWHSPLWCNQDGTVGEW